MATVSADGTTLYYEALGSGTPMVMIHGTQPDATVWSTVLAPLAKQTRVIASDRCDFSRSQASFTPDYRVHVRDAAALLTAIGATPAIVVGWSLSGLIALELAATKPDVIKSLVLVEPAVHMKKRPTLTVIRTLMTVQILGKIG